MSIIITLLVFKDKTSLKAGFRRISVYQNTLQRHKRYVVYVYCINIIFFSCLISRSDICYILKACFHFRLSKIIGLCKMSKPLTNREIIRLWSKTTCIAIVLALGIQVITKWMKNDVSSLPTPVECDSLTTQQLTQKFNSFEKFYPFYLCEHTEGVTKLFHFVATVNVLAILAVLLMRKWQPKLFAFGFIQGYGLAWFSHFFIEHNRPATWTYPTYSFFADFRMFYDIVTLKFPLFMWLIVSIQS